MAPHWCLCCYATTRASSGLFIKAVGELSLEDFFQLKTLCVQATSSLPFLELPCSAKQTQGNGRSAPNNKPDLTKLSARSRDDESGGVCVRPSCQRTAVLARPAGRQMKCSTVVQASGGAAGLPCACSTEARNATSYNSSRQHQHMRVVVFVTHDMMMIYILGFHLHQPLQHSN